MEAVMSNENSVQGYHAEVLYMLDKTPIKIQLANYANVTDMVSSAWRLVDTLKNANVSKFYFAYYHKGGLYSIATYKIKNGISHDIGFYGTSPVSVLHIDELDISAWDNA
jgi:hypothetical protein